MDVSRQGHRAGQTQSCSACDPELLPPEALHQIVRIVLLCVNLHVARASLVCMYYIGTSCRVPSIFRPRSNRVPACLPAWLGRTPVHLLLHVDRTIRSERGTCIYVLLRANLPSGKLVCPPRRPPARSSYSSVGYPVSPSVSQSSRPNALLPALRPVRLSACLPACLSVHLNEDQYRSDFSLLTYS